MLHTTLRTPSLNHIVSLLPGYGGEQLSSASALRGNVRAQVLSVTWSRHCTGHDESDASKASATNYVREAVKEGRRSEGKVRARLYLDSQVCRMEVRPGKEQTVRNQLFSLGLLDDLLDHGVERVRPARLAPQPVHEVHAALRILLHRPPSNTKPASSLTLERVRTRLKARYGPLTPDRQIRVTSQVAPSGVCPPLKRAAWAAASRRERASPSSAATRPLG